MKIGDRVRYFTDSDPGVLTYLWHENQIGWIAEVQCDGYEYTCFLSDLVPVPGGQE